MRDVRNNLGGRITFGQGLSKVNDGHLPKQHSIKDLFGNRVVNIDREARDRSMNEEIQEKGAHCWPRV